MNHFKMASKRPHCPVLLKRLKQVCALENLQIESQILNDLCNANQLDIRACLNTLQYLKVQPATSRLSSKVLSLRPSP